MKRDQSFFDRYSIVIGALLAVAVAIYIVSAKMSDLTQGVYTRDTTEYQTAVEERIRPVGQIYLPGEEHDAEAPTVETVSDVPPVATTLTGPQVYNAACLACHGSGIGGAPILGDKDAWAPRIAQGDDVLKSHAIDGFTNVGFMPPKGGRVDLSDQEIYDALDYMVGESQ